MERLKQWCEDVNALQDIHVFDFVYVDQSTYEQYKPTNFQALAEICKQYKD